MKRRLWTAMIVFAITVSGVTAQQNLQTVTGSILDEDKNPITFASVFLKETIFGTVSDKNGSYSLNVPSGNYVLVASAIGFKTTEINIVVKGQTKPGQNLVLKKDIAEIDEVQITAKTIVQQARERAFNISAIDAGQLYNTSASINEVLNRTTGVRVRQSGGMGSGFNFSINGFSGNQVKFFIDGIPLENFGSALSFDNIPVNMAERIEVYKGVVPVSLGADALGGAVNLITKQKSLNYLDASYSVGSFNSHKASVNFRQSSKSGFTVNTNAFVNYSDNSYGVDLSIADPNTGVYGPVQEFKHFHDGYKSATIKTEAGILGRSWADQLLVGLIVSGNEKEIQQGSNMQRVVGEAFTDGRSITPNIRYENDDLFAGKLAMKLYSSYYLAENRSVDTSSVVYDWTGNSRPRSYGDNALQGELGEKTIYIYNERNWLINTNLTYRLGGNHLLTFNYVHNDYLRDEKDEYNPDKYGLNSPSISKYIGGLEYKLRSFDERLSVSVFGKLFLMDNELVIGDTVTISSSIQNPGYGIAAAWHLAPVWQVKASYERTNRLPSPAEILGDGININSNPNLKPEQSNNLNIGLSFLKTNRRNQLSAEAGFVYRDASDFIRNTIDGARTIYENLSSVRGTGVETSFRFKQADCFTFEVNGTWQKLINTDKYVPGTQQINDTYKQQVPNVPYLFGNADMGFNFRELFRENDRLFFDLSCNYAEAFYLYWPKYGNPDNKRSIPQQITGNFGIGYSLHNGKYNISADCQNFTDTKVYDYYNIQKPGRSFSVKLRYFLQ
jgi:outer membrane receptor protein involved in Fe transport